MAANLKRATKCFQFGRNEARACIPRSDRVFQIKNDLELHLLSMILIILLPSWQELINFEPRYLAQF